MTSPLFPDYDPALVCGKCGTWSPNGYVHHLNHDTIFPGDELCGSQRLRLRHITYGVKNNLEDVSERIDRARDLHIPNHYIQQASSPTTTVGHYS